MRALARRLPHRCDQQVRIDIDVFSARELPTVCRALRTALAPAGALTQRERSFLDTYARITGFDLPAADPQLIVAGIGATSPYRKARHAGARERRRMRV